MARVQLITTGVMEERALGRSLQRLFPEHELVSRPHLDGFTSARLPPTPPLARVPLNLDKLASTLVGVFDPGNRRDRPAPTSWSPSTTWSSPTPTTPPASRLRSVNR